DQTRMLALDRVQKREHLYGFSEAHVVREAAAETEPAQKMKPPQSVALVLTQLSGKRRRHFGGANAGKGREFLTYPRESFLKRDFRLFGEKDVEQARLMEFKPQLSITRFSKRGDQTVSFEPLFRNDSVRSVAQTHGVFAARDGLQKLRHFQTLT